MKKNKVAYLAGAIEILEDEGIYWRRIFSKALKRYNIDCIIPNDEEGQVKIKEKVDLKEMKKVDIDRYVEIVRGFIKMDLEFVETADMFIVKWEGELTSGTFHETGYAYQLKKPCYLVTSKPLCEVPGWFLACCTKTFPNLDALLKFIKEE